MTEFAIKKDFYLQPYINPSDHLKAGIHYFWTDFCSNLQSGEVDASCLKSEPVCRFELTVYHTYIWAFSTTRGGDDRTMPAL